MCGSLLLERLQARGQACLTAPFVNAATAFHVSWCAQERPPMSAAVAGSWYAVILKAWECSDGLVSFLHLTLLCPPIVGP